MPRATLILGAPPTTLGPRHPDYPAGLRDLSDPPQRLRVAGRLPKLPGIAIVGTRAASESALEFAYDLAADLAVAGVTVVSGGALGVDTAAHQGALSVGGHTVALLASGLRFPYPPTNKSLFEDIAAGGGALVSEAADDAHPARGRFLSRNRLIAGLSEAVIVVQAPARSGAMSTANWAKLLGRRLFCVPGNPWDVRFSGCNLLLREQAEICTSARDVLSVRPPGLGEDPPGSLQDDSNTNDFQGLDDGCRAVFEQLGIGNRDPDRIAVALDIPINRVHECLLSLELAGAVGRNTGGGYSLRRTGTRRRPRYGSDQEEGHQEEGHQEEGSQEGVGQQRIGQHHRRGAQEEGRCQDGGTKAGGK